MTVHINRPSSTRFRARVRLPGHQTYILLGTPTRSKAVAIKRMAAAMATGDYKRGDVILIADWYEPVPLIEMVCR